MPGFLWLGILALVGIVGALVALWRLVARRGAVTLVSADVEGGEPWVLRDRALGVEAVADHILQVRDEHGRSVLFPHELKPTRRARRPYDADVVQLAAQMAGLRARVGKQFAGFGMLEYSEGRQFRIAWDERVADLLVRAVQMVRTLRASPIAPDRTHDSRAVCAHCPVAASCDQQLV